jgi:hypothetical protein
MSSPRHTSLKMLTMATTAASATRGRLEEEHEPTEVNQHLAKGTEEASKTQGAVG